MILLRCLFPIYSGFGLMSFLPNSMSYYPPDKHYLGNIGVLASTINTIAGFLGAVTIVPLSISCGLATIGFGLQCFVFYNA